MQQVRGAPQGFRERPSPDHTRITPRTIRPTSGALRDRLRHEGEALPSRHSAPDALPGSAGTSPSHGSARDLGTTTMFRVTREIEFCYGHRLLNYEGKCRHLHGHNGRAVVTLEGPELDSAGHARRLRRHQANGSSAGSTRTSTTTCCSAATTRSCRSSATAASAFRDGRNPTAENIARLIFDKAREAGLPVLEVVALGDRELLRGLFRGP